MSALNREGGEIPPLKVDEVPHPAPADDLGFALPQPVRLSRTRAAAIAACVAAVLGTAFLVAYLPKRTAQASLEAATQATDHARLRVDVVTPKVLESDQAMVLPASVQALEETTVFSRANGYVRRWLVDIGEHVEEGQLLAELETPEVDQEISQARAQLAQAEAGILLSKANREYSRSNLERYKLLAPQGVASQQDLDQRQAQASVDEANVTVAQATAGAQQANLSRLSQLKSFGRVVAPFGGLVTARWIERGALVTSGNATPLYKITATDPVRVLVQVPQGAAASVKVGATAKVRVREHAGRAFDGTVARFTGTLDSGSRTMMTEVRVPNPAGELLAGMYAEVSISLPASHRVFELPATALQNDSKGLRVATVDADDKVHFVTVVVERDTGGGIQISGGLEGAERVVKIANAELVEGRAVDVVR